MVDARWTKRTKGRSRALPDDFEITPDARHVTQRPSYRRKQARAQHRKEQAQRDSIAEAPQETPIATSHPPEQDFEQPTF